MTHLVVGLILLVLLGKAMVLAVVVVLLVRFAIALPAMAAELPSFIGRRIDRYQAR